MSAVEFHLEAIAVLVILLPGFLTARIVQHATFGKEQSELDKIVQALLYSFCIYVIYTAVRGRLPVSIESEATKTGAEYHIHSDPRGLLILVSIAVLLAIALCFVAHRDLGGKTFRYFKLSARSWRASVWTDVFHEYGDTVRIELSDGRAIMGWLKLYSDTAKESSLFVERAAWVSGTELVPIDGPGIFLTRDSGIQSVSFLHLAKPAPPPSQAVNTASPESSEIQSL
jgi:Family of unknown function (DUF6338)